MVPGSDGLVESEADLIENARRIGFPLMLKATGGGGGMGLLVCNNEEQLLGNFQAVKSRGDALFKNAGVLMERYFPSSHHIEVQIFGNGKGQVLSIGERECSIQRRHQKVIEECPSPFVESRFPAIRQKLCEHSVRLAQSVSYRSAGTVEFLVDHDTGDFFFLEMNTRLQVEHGITELCYQVDLVEMMYQQADAQLRGQAAFDKAQVTVMQQRLNKPSGHAIEARVYAENAVRNFAPSAGLLQQVDWHELPGTRVDTWIRAGNMIGPDYDPLLAKVMQFSSTRAEAVVALQSVLKKSSVRGLTLNIDFLLSVISDGCFLRGDTPTSFLKHFSYRPSAIDIVSGGSQTLVQDLPGRPSVGHGFGHSGPMDPLAFQIANVLVGNPRGTEGLEINLRGPEMVFLSPGIVALCGPAVTATLDDNGFPLWTRVRVAAGQRLSIGTVDVGCRVYLAIYGGLPGIANWFGSKATCPGSRIGGYQGRALRAGDLLTLTPLETLKDDATTSSLPKELCPVYSHDWEVQAMPGPYETGYLSRADIDQVYSQAWKVSHNAARGGIRLVGPTPQFARSDGGEGGAHPSNVIEYGYPIGGLNWTGDQPVILPVDCPDFGGHMCSLTIISGDWWKMGQIRPGDTVRFHRVGLETARHARKTHDEFISGVASALKNGAWQDVVGINHVLGPAAAHRDASDVLGALQPTGTRPQVSYRAGGDRFLLVDYGTGKADLNHKCRALMLKKALESQTDVCGLESHASQRALQNIVTCGNSLMIHFDNTRIAPGDLVKRLIQLEDEMGSTLESVIPNRRFRLPIAFSHPKVGEAMQRYMVNQRGSAPYLPDPFDFIARNNGITTDKLKSLILHVEAVVIGVGFLMALPQSLPLDPRHRLNVPKMNPSRVSTPAGTVSWGGNAIAIYTHDSPGGYMPIGLTIPGLDIYGSRDGFTPDRPWLFEDLDIITFYEVSVQELDAQLVDFEAGRYRFQCVPDAFDLAAYRQLVRGTADEVTKLEVTRREAQQRMAHEEQRMFENWTAEKRLQEIDLRNAESLARGMYRILLLLLPTLQW